MCMNCGLFGEALAHLQLVVALEKREQSVAVNQFGKESVGNQRAKQRK